MSSEGAFSKLMGQDLEPSNQRLIQPTVKASDPLKETKQGTVKPRNHDTMVSPNGGGPDVVEVVRKAVKQLGKEAATYRFTAEEKKALSDIVYSYKGKGLKTSENEITRISINFLIQEHKDKSNDSILARVLERLNE